LRAGGYRLVDRDVKTDTYREFVIEESKRVLDQWIQGEAKLKAAGRDREVETILGPRPNIPRFDSMWDGLPVVGTARDFLYHIENRDLQAATLSGLLLVADVLPVAKVASQGARLAWQGARGLMGTAALSFIRREAVPAARAVVQREAVPAVRQVA